MSSDRPQEFSQQPVSRVEQTPDHSADHAGLDQHAGSNAEPSDDAGRPATVLVRGETLREPQQKSAQDASSKDLPAKGKEKPPRKEVSEAKVKLQSRLPELEDDSDIGTQKEYIVTRDGKPDLAFAGTLVASAAPPSAPKGKWKEYRIYETSAGKHVFSKITRSVFAEDQDGHEAEVFDPSPSSVPSQLLRSARDLARSRPMTWTDAAVSYFGYDPLAKVLYRKIGGQFEEHIS